MPNPVASLLSSRRFFPYFMTQFFGAFNDNVFKNTLLLLVAYAGTDELAISSSLFINLAAGLFILPFFLFSASSGVLADQLEKSALIRKIKLLEILIMVMAAIGFMTQSYFVLLLLLFLMGTQSALFGPVKYALLPQQLRSEELVTGNALVETGTFLAILLGTLLSGLIASADQARLIAAACVLSFALFGYVASRYIPRAESSLKAPDAFRWRPVRQTRHTLSIAGKDPVIWLTILTISWFWFLGATYLTQFPNFTREYLHGSESAVSFLLALFSVGIALGSMLCERLSRYRLELGIVPVGCLGISIFGFGFSTLIPAQLPRFETLTAFVSASELWPLFIHLLLLGASGGVFIVPLYTLLQRRAKPEERAQVIAALNIYNALLMVCSAITGIVCLTIFHFSIPQLFMLLSIVNTVIFIYLTWKIPVYVIRFLLTIVLRLCYRIRFKNLSHIPNQGGALIVCNHVSYIDALLLIIASPRLIRFVMESDYAKFPAIRPLMKRAGVIPIDGRRPSEMKNAFTQIQDALDMGDLVCIFPEGRLTSDGKIGSFMRGINLILYRAPEVPVIPVALKGLWGSFFSRYHQGRACSRFPRRFFSRVELEAGEAIPAKEVNHQILANKVAALRGDTL
ncbi:Lysophospholipid transporter LplT [Vibrio aerogenes CECT 7868]|uniref:Lysophospholipid transporter LplT n=1 Tax=Vibrio aerogenes CECT 7868 TaxID=1216006 RepID=A0A1M5Y034_9VIBR|nr:MFS transporter [Vibrio aerogenes]SHI05352.1 Lysophospholipid transporter LplT [Vibrio aerogenes CECT 7868]